MTDHMTTMLTGGRIVFGKTVQPEPYHSNKAEAEFSFTVPEGVSTEEALRTIQYVQDLAVVKVHDMLGKKVEAKVASAATATPKTGGTAAPVVRTKADIEAEVTAAATKAPAGKAAPRKPPAAAKGEATPNITANPENRVDPAQVDDAAAIGDEDFGAPVETMVPVVEVTDADLQAACGKKNQEIKDAIKIRGVIAKYGLQLAAIPQDKRKEFLTELAALTK